MSTEDWKNVWNLWQKLWFYWKFERANKLKWVKILKNENIDASQNCPLILLQPFLRLAYTTLKRKEFSGLLENVKYFLLTFCANRFFENIHQSGPRNWEKTVICVPIYTTEQSDHRIKQVKTYLRPLRKADIQIRANSIGKDWTQAKTSYGYRLKTWYEFGVIIWASKFFYFSLKRICK